jgi:GDP/UDP-N,N'-diacetylbacillosamine 2-epimerase (hydrolysing)
MGRIRDDVDLRLQVIATGSHLSPEFGLTIREIESDGFPVDATVEMLLSSDTPVGITKSIGLGVIGFADALHRIQPDLVVVLGDRMEIYASVTACLVARIPVAHIHGGEITEGAIDEAFRHSITKMSQLHFVAAEQYRRRVIQLGEDPERVFNVGGLGVDSLKRTQLLTRDELEADLDVRFGPRSLLITFHPVTLEHDTAKSQMSALLQALSKRTEACLIFTMPNADTDGRVIIKMIDDFVAVHPNARAYTSLGHRRYLSCVNQVNGVVGNSSSGLLEVPSLKKGTINIGDRQRGRIKAASVIDCEPTEESISAAIELLFSMEFNKKLESVSNPYGDGGASDRIVEQIKARASGLGIKKKFYDLDEVSSL